MKGDFSRLTFEKERHYRRVLQQQGRVQLDADANEQIAIDVHLVATTAADVIGPAGYPAGTDGFALSVAPGGADLEIGKGRMYVDGIVVENDVNGVTLLQQPDLPGVTASELGATEEGTYLVYLDVWERVITALDDPHIRESALGGPDTSVRTKLVWQVRLALVGGLPAGTGPTCANAAGPWENASGPGTLSASIADPGTPLPCVLPPETGYQRLENQLYRVEIHNPGADGTATFKWSRENGSVVTRITGTDPAGGYTVEGLKNDPTLAYANGDWVELIDDHAELLDGRGALYQVSAAGDHTITLTSPPAALGQTPTRLRRWDQQGADVGDGITVITGAPIPLEGGVVVEFSKGTYRSGDYWLIPARTATSVDQGFLDWPTEGGVPVPRPPFGSDHHYAKLGLVDVTIPAGGTPTFGPADTLVDCRVPFPSLTSVVPAGSGPCTIVVEPGPGWDQPLRARFPDQPQEGDPRLDAEICFPIGEFPVSREPVRIAHGGHIRLNGAGWGTRIRATGADGGAGPESALEFDDCLSVSVRDLYCEATQVSASGITGALAFLDCGEVTVEDAWVRCGSAVSTRGAACISVASTIPDANAASGAGTARIRGCLLHVGEMQVGIQLVQQARAVVEENEILADPEMPATSLENRLADPVYLAAAVRALAPALAAQAPPASPPPPAAPPPAQPPAPPPAGGGGPAPGPVLLHAEVGPVAHALEIAAGTAPGIVHAAPAGGANPPPGSEANTAGNTEAAAAQPAESGAEKIIVAPAGALEAALKLNVGGQQLNFASGGGGLDATWQALLAQKPAPEFANKQDAANFLKSTAKSILTTPAEFTNFSGFVDFRRMLSSHIPLPGRGIVVGGRAIGDLHICGNAVSGFLMGISVGVSHHESRVETRQQAGDRGETVRITDNAVACQANDIAGQHGRFGIFVGNVASLQVDGNRVSLTASGIRTAPEADGIRVFGYLGARAVIRGNDVSAFPTGIRVVALDSTKPGRRAQLGHDTVKGAYTEATRAGSQWLVADNVIAGARLLRQGTVTGVLLPFLIDAVDAPACLQVNNAVIFG